MRKHWAGSAAVLGGVVLPLHVGLVWAEVKAQPPGDSDSRTVRGRVQRFTTAPKGEVDGMVLDDGTVVHWPPHLENKVTAVVA
jgi:hypothetical protein